MSAKINNFINLGIGNAGDGGESLPVYGVYWRSYEIMFVFEIADITNPYDEFVKLNNYIDTYDEEDLPNFKNLIFSSECGTNDDDETEYKDNNHTLNRPRLTIADINDVALGSGTTFIKGFAEDDTFAGDKLFQTLGISNGIFMGIYVDSGNDSKYHIMGIIKNSGDNDYDGIGVYSAYAGMYP